MYLVFESLLFPFLSSQEGGMASSGLHLFLYVTVSRSLEIFFFLFFFFLEHNQQIALDKRFCLDCQNAGASTIPGKMVPEREKEKNKNETTQMDFAVHHH